MPKKIAQLTKSQVEAFIRKPSADGKSKEVLRDGDGLLLIKRGMSCSWKLQYRISGKRREIAIGPTKDYSIAQARQRASELRQLVAEGIDPVLARQAEDAILAEKLKKATSFGDLADDYLKKNATSWSDKTEKQWITDLSMKCSPIRKKPIDEIKEEYIAALIEPIWNTQFETADRLLRRISSVFKTAVAKGLINRNPADRDILVRGGYLPAREIRPVKHHAALEHSEVGDFLRSMAQIKGIAARAVELVVYTVLRSNELRGAKWSEIDFREAIWSVPAHRMKDHRSRAKTGDEPFRVPLSDQALDILKALKGTRARSGFIFPGSGASGYISEASLRKAMKKADAGSNTSIHGFRSCLKTWVANETTFPRWLGEKCLAHKVESDIERSYQRSDQLERRREIMQAWANYVTQEEQTNVVQLRK